MSDKAGIDWDDLTPEQPIKVPDSPRPPPVEKPLKPCKVGSGQTKDGQGTIEISCDIP